MKEKYTCFGHVNDTRADLKAKGISIGNCPVCHALAHCVEEYDARVYDPDTDIDEENEEDEEDENW